MVKNVIISMMKKEHIPDYRGLEITDIAARTGLTPAEVLKIDESIRQKAENFLVKKGHVRNIEEAKSAMQGFSFLLPDGSSYTDFAFFDQFETKKVDFLSKVKS